MKHFIVIAKLLVSQCLRSSEVVDRRSYFDDERRDELVVGDARDGGLGEGGLGDGLGDAAERGGRRRQHHGRRALHRHPHAALGRRAGGARRPRPAQEVRRDHRLELLVGNRPRRLRV